MSTENEKKNDKTDAILKLLSELDETTTSELIDRLQENAVLQRHSPGWLGKIFGGQENAATNITGLIAALAMAAIVAFGLRTNDSAPILEICKAVLFLAMGALASKKLGSSE